MQAVAEGIQRHLPPVVNAIAYGSAAFAQAGRQPGPMLDLLLVVAKPRQWHHRNLALNPHHYSMVARAMGAGAIEAVQNAPGGLYFNTDVDLGGTRVKYGVVSQERAVHDLTTWRDLMFAGRLHKPVHSLLGTDTQVWETNDRVNRPSALLLSLQRLQCRSRRSAASWFDAFVELVQISYAGDIRMALPAEDKRKVWRIVEGQFGELVKVYLPLAARLGLDHCRDTVQLANIDDDLIIKHHTRGTVLRSSTVQSIKGLFSAKPATAAAYLLAKFKKRLFT